MALNILKCNYLMPLHFKGLTDVHGLSDGEYLLLVNIVDILRNGDLYRNTDIRPAYTYASLIRQVRYKLFMIFLPDLHRGFVVWWHFL